MYKQIIDCTTIRHKWEKLHELYKEYTEASRGDGIQTNPPIPRKVNTFILNSLIQYPKYADPRPDRPSMFEHISYMQVLYEGLVSRNADITEQEFIDLVHNNLSNFPELQAFVRFLDSQAKKRGSPNVPIQELLDGIEEYEAALNKEKIPSLRA